MLLSIVQVLLLASTAAALDNKRRDASTLIQDIGNIDAGVKALTVSIEAFQGTPFVTSLVDGAPVLADVAAIHVANRKGYVDALASSTLDASDSTAVVNYTIDTVGVDIPAGIKDLEAKKKQFEEAGQTLVVLASLELLLNDHNTFSAALEEKLTADQAAGSAVVAKIRNAIQGGIVDYSS